MTDRSAHHQRIKREFIKARGFWDDAYDGLVTFCPDFFEAHLALSSYACKSETISPKVMELIAIAIDASTTHLYEPGLRIHIRNALSLGATTEEIAEVFQLVSDIGVQSLLVNLPVLSEQFEAAGSTLLKEPLSLRAEALKREFVTVVGLWSEGHEALLRRSPDYFERYCALTSAAWRGGRLEPKVKSLVCLAVNASVTHLNTEAVRLECRRALAKGATPREIIEVLQRVGGLGMHACMVGMPLLLQEVAARET